MKTLILLATLAFLTAALVACGAAAEESPYPGDGFPESASAPQSIMDMEAPEAAPAQPTPAPAVASEVSMVPAAMPASAPAVAASDQLLGDLPPSLEEAQSRVAAQERIIVRTVHMSLIAADVSQAIDRVTQLAQELGGWMVTTDRGSRHHGFVSIRVPAQRLDEAVKRVRGLATEVVSESSTSQDVTDEYVDSQSHLKTLRATEESILQLLQKAVTVEEALEVQRDLVEIQAEIETILGRIKFLEQTSAFSKINVELSLAPVEMTVDAGQDRTFSVGQAARFRAHFVPPEGIEDFLFTWDFGDGTERVTGAGTAPTTEPGQRVTATVNHVYHDDLDSPYIVQLEINGSGPGGLVEGSDTLIATVTEVPSLSVFAGEGRMVEEGQEEEYTGSFTRPEGLWDLQYRWTFGDGSAPVTGVPEEGVTKATASHTYLDHRPEPYVVTLTVEAQSDAGPVEGSSSFPVRVREARGLIIAGWSAGDTARTAVRALSGVIQAVGTLIIWAAIFIPVWLVLGAAIYGVIRLRRHWRQRNRSLGGRPDPTEPHAAGADAETTGAQE